MLTGCFVVVVVQNPLSWLMMVTFCFCSSICSIVVALILCGSLKEKGHADDAMVLRGQVRQVDRLGNDAADEAADFGRRRVSPAVNDARRNLSGVCARWYPIVLDLHRFFHCYFSCGG